VNSIRRRTTTLVALCTLAVLALGVIALYMALRHIVTVQFDQALLARADALRALSHFDGHDVEMDFSAEAMPQFAAPSGSSLDNEQFFVARVLDASSGKWRLVERSRSLTVATWPEHDPPPGVTSNITLPDGSSGRIGAIEFHPIREEDDEADRNPTPAAVPSLAPSADTIPLMRIVVATSRAPLDRTLAAMALSISGIGALLAVAATLAARWAVAHGLTPLNSLSSKVAHIGPEALDANLAVAELPAELRPIAEQLTSLLSRLRVAFERERRFSAAASHELRTPIAELRMLLEVAASRPRSDQEWRATSSTAIGVLDRAQSLCESLLSLARAQQAKSNSTGAPRGPTLLAPILNEAAARATRVHSADALRVDCPSNIAVLVDSEKVTAAIGILFDNALRHGEATPQSPATCVVHAEGSWIRVTVSNHAPNLVASDLDRLFEPFWQGDASRARRAGFGLGLALCRALIESCRGSVEATVSPGRVLSLTICLPRS